MHAHAEGSLTMMKCTAPFSSMPHFSAPGKFMTSRKRANVVAWWYMCRKSLRRPCHTSTPVSTHCHTKEGGTMRSKLGNC